MPELPEVETSRSDLDTHIAGRTLSRIEIRGGRTVRRGVPSDIIPALVQGARVERVGRHGKFVLVALRSHSGGSMVLAIHFGMSGRLVVESDESDRLIARHIKVAATFSAGEHSEDRRVVLYDPRTFGEIFLSEGVGERGLPVELVGLGPDPILEPDAVLPSLRRSTAGSAVAVKTRLLDQRVIAGLGNIYSDEVLHRSRISPLRRCSELRTMEVETLARNVIELLHGAVALRGSSLRDMSYLDLGGVPGGFQRHHRVYARSGEPCFECGGPITRIMLQGRSAHFCPSCQR